MDEFPSGAVPVRRTISLAPRKVKGWVFEVKVPLEKGVRLRYRTRHDRPSGEVKFNIHSHEGRTVTYHMQTQDPALEGTFTAPWTGDFYLMWENHTERSVPVDLELERRGAPS